LTEPTKKKILVVDDDSAFRDLIKVYLETAGYEILEANNGDVGEIKARLFEVDAILTDIRMPEVDGLELMRHVKKKSSIPVILMTAYKDLTITKNPKDLGADGILEKPFEGEDLVSMLAKLLN